MSGHLDPEQLQALSDACARIKDSFTLSAVVRNGGVKLIAKGDEYVACCPLHADRSPSFTIFADDRAFYCFGCGAGGDVLEYVQRAYRVGVFDAIGMLDDGELSALKQQLAPPREKPDTTAAAARLWREAGPIAGTPAEAYLRGRGITLDLPPSLRFGMLRVPKGSGLREQHGTALIPALLALVTGQGLDPCGVQRTFLTTDGGKAAASDGKVKFSLGDVRGGAIRLAAAGSEVAVTEGIEDALSLLQLGAPSAWAAAGSSMLPSIRFPDEVRSVVVGADADDAGRRAADKAARSFAEQGREVRVIYPTPPARDFNDELQGPTA